MLRALRRITKLHVSLPARHLALVALIGTASLGASGGCAASEETGTSEDAIIGGVPSREHPAAVAITRDGAPHCTGTLIAPRYVLTAAHCLNAWNPRELTVLFNAQSSAIGADPSAVAIAPTRSWVHPDYGGSTHAHDLGVLELARVAPVSPARVYTGALSSAIIGLDMGLVGYGKTAPSEPAGRRLETRARILDLLPLHVVHEAKTCPGDSGGPGFLSTRSGQEVLVAVHSYGSCGQGSPSGKSRLDIDKAFWEPFYARQGEDPQPNPAPPRTEPVPHTPPAGPFTETIEITYDRSAPAEAYHSVRCPPIRSRLAIELVGRHARAFFRYENAVVSPTQHDLRVDGTTYFTTGSDEMYPGLWSILVQANGSLAGARLAVRCTP